MKRRGDKKELNYWEALTSIITDFQKWIKEESKKVETSETEIQALIKEMLNRHKLLDEKMENKNE